MRHCAKYFICIISQYPIVIMYYYHTHFIDEITEAEERLLDQNHIDLSARARVCKPFS